MADERQRTKSAVKRLFTNLKNKPITDEMISILIDLLWRDKISQRSAGFEYPDPGVALISFDSPTRTFSIEPFDPEIDEYLPRYAFYSFSETATYHRVFEPLTLQIPDEEGLYLFYFDREPEPGRQQILTVQKNPTSEQLENIIKNKATIASVYWDADNKGLLYFGNEKHGSQWNSHIHWYLQSTFGAVRSSGLQLEDFSINEDGSDNSHAQFTVTGGVMLHDDFPLTIPSFGNSIPILYFSGGLPRFLSNSGFACYNGAGRIRYNSGTISLTEATESYHVIYHIFAVNEHVNADRKIVSVMGQNEYETLAEAYISCSSELNTITALMPQQGRCYLGSIIYQTSNNYTNSVKSRVVAHIGSEESHPPVTIAPGSEALLAINDKQELSATPYQLPFATPTVLGGIKLGTGLSMDENAIVTVQTHAPVRIATASEALLNINEDQELSATPYQLPVASALILGGIKLGTGLSIDEDGVVTVASTFLGLDDVIPESYLGKAWNVPRVTDEEDGLDFVETEEIQVVDALFKELIDCPDSYAGYAGYLVRVKLDETGLEFIAP